MKISTILLFPSFLDWIVVTIRLLTSQSASICRDSRCIGETRQFRRSETQANCLSIGQNSSWHYHVIRSVSIDSGCAAAAFLSFRLVGRGHVPRSTHV